jgi:hypothetical protein
LVSVEMSRRIAAPVPACCHSREDAPTAILEALDRTDVVLVYGAPRVGKTTVCEQVAAASSCDFIRWDLLAPVASAALIASPNDGRMDRFLSGPGSSDDVILFADDADVAVQLQGNQGAVALASALASMVAASRRPGRRRCKALLVATSPHVIPGSSKPARDVAGFIGARIGIMANVPDIPGIQGIIQGIQGLQGDPRTRMDALVIETAAEWDSGNPALLAVAREIGSRAASRNFGTGKAPGRITNSQHE